jgi:hypothetical protein
VVNYRTLFSARSARLAQLSPPANVEPAPQQQTEPDGAADFDPEATEPMGQTPRRLMGIWIMALSAVALGHLPWAWSLAEQVASSRHPVHAHWLGIGFTPQKASALLIVVIVTALIGSAATLAITFANRVGFMKLEKGWEWWYLTRPPTAASIGVLAFALLQAGFLTNSTAVKSDLLAAVATGGLAGLFTDQVLQKMRAALGLGAFDKSASGAARQSA